MADRETTCWSTRRDASHSAGSRGIGLGSWGRVPPRSFPCLWELWRFRRRMVRSSIFFKVSSRGCRGFAVIENSYACKKRIVRIDPGSSVLPGPAPPLAHLLPCSFKSEPTPTSSDSSRPSATSERRFPSPNYSRIYLRVKASAVVLHCGPCLPVLSSFPSHRGHRHGPDVRIAV